METCWDRGTQPGQGAAADAPTLPPEPLWQRGLDPYFRWARHTDWRGFTVHAGWARVPNQEAEIQIIAEARDEAMLKAALDCSWLQVPAAYHAPIPGTEYHARCFTARIHRQDEALLMNNALGLRWELALPLRDAERLVEGSSHGLLGPTRAQSDFRADNIAADEIAAAWSLGRPEVRPRIDGALAVIDFGCPFLNDSFVTDERESKARVVALWDQGSGLPHFADIERAVERGLDAAHWPWVVPTPFGYGREMGPKALQALVNRSIDPARPPADERAIYRGVDYLIDSADPRRRVWYATHGSHVLDLVGGETDPVTGARGDPASWASLVFVQLPGLTAADSSGGALSSHVLDGVRYVLDVCAPGHPLVVNVSYGTYAGPHDGSSLIERALDELLVQRQRNFAIVLAAGNARAACCHARRQVRSDRSAMLRCWIDEGDTTDTFIELWYAPPGAQAHLELRARGPDRLWSDWVRPEDEELLRVEEPQERVVAMLRHDRLVPNGSRAMALLALAPTARPADLPGPTLGAGPWDIEVRLVGTRAAEIAGGVDIEAWIERDDPGALGGKQPHRFLDLLADDDAGTLSSLATGQFTIRAGAMVRDTGRMPDYSSIDLALRSPEDRFVLAAAEADSATPGLWAAAVRSGERLLMNGTSVAAPVLARRLYNHMVERGPVSLEQWPRVLRRLVDAEARHDRPVLRAAEEPPGP